VKGRKRHIVTDIEGHLLHVKVHAANIHDTKAAPQVLNEVKAK
jgi:putative transposase